MILPYNRVVKDLNGMDCQEFLKAAAERFRIEELGVEGELYL